VSSRSLLDVPLLDLLPAGVLLGATLISLGYAVARQNLVAAVVAVALAILAHAMVIAAVSR
jgi:hypothetical protein